MGSGSWSSDSFRTYSHTSGLLKASSVGEVYKNKAVQIALNPKGIKLRESRDGPDHPSATPIIIGLDVTGSMGQLATSIAKDQLNELITKIYDEKPCTDPQMMFLALGDSECDSAPLQVTQFESDIRIAEQLREVYFEAGGGGNDGESYNLAYYFAAKKTDTDQFSKRGKKGFLFTIGDEKCLDDIKGEALQEFLGDKGAQTVKTKDILKEAQEKYNVYHLIVKPRSGQDEIDHWKKLLGNNAIVVKDPGTIPQVITDLIKVSNVAEDASDPVTAKSTKKPKKDKVVLD
jgi:hypothetical protein